MSSQNLSLGSEVVVTWVMDCDREWGLTGGERGTIVKCLDQCPMDMFVEVEIDGRIEPIPFNPDQLRLA